MGISPPCSPRVRASPYRGADGSIVTRTLRFATSKRLKAEALAIYQTWLGSQLYHITSDVTIPSGVVLTIQPGAVIKFDANTSIVLQPGSQLIAAGTVAQPIYFTSIKDDSIAGDTNGDGNATSPAAGNWRWILGERQRPRNPGPRLDQLRRGQQQPNMEQHWRNSHRRHGLRRPSPTALSRRCSSMALRRWAAW